ncbi:hypothetical protein PR048_010429 [Dryococelus australis]|uniref:Uncharacterized protein n=1 Tax=Dryococelus australis TaxID=614101 RepID=A0ABQ9I3U2_9NEOP|nr:hypothetical protein PR048_010429 [Dryococelus australis]
MVIVGCSETTRRSDSVLVNCDVSVLAREISLIRPQVRARRLSVHFHLGANSGLEPETFLPPASHHYSPPTQTNQVRFPAGPPLDFRMWESCRTMLLIGSQDLDKIILIDSRLAIADWWRDVVWSDDSQSEDSFAATWWLDRETFYTNAPTVCCAMEHVAHQTPTRQPSCCAMEHVAHLTPTRQPSYCAMEHVAHQTPTRQPSCCAMEHVAHQTPTRQPSYCAMEHVAHQTPTRQPSYCAMEHVAHQTPTRQPSYCAMEHVAHQTPTRQPSYCAMEHVAHQTPTRQPSYCAMEHVAHQTPTRQPSCCAMEHVAHQTPTRQPSYCAMEHVAHQTPTRQPSIVPWSTSHTKHQRLQCQGLDDAHGRGFRVACHGTSKYHHNHTVVCGEVRCLLCAVHTRRVSTRADVKRCCSLVPPMAGPTWGGGVLTELSVFALLLRRHLADLGHMRSACHLPGHRALVSARRGSSRASLCRSAAPEALLTLRAACVFAGRINRVVCIIRPTLSGLVEYASRIRRGGYIGIAVAPTPPVHGLKSAHLSVDSVYLMGTYAPHFFLFVIRRVSERWILAAPIFSWATARGGKRQRGWLGSTPRPSEYDADTLTVGANTPTTLAELPKVGRQSAPETDWSEVSPADKAFP